nr:Protein R07E5.6 [Haemonchus contortus]
MRKAKLRWKNPEKAKAHSPSDSATKTEPSFSSAEYVHLRTSGAARTEPFNLDFSTSAGGEETVLEKEGSEELDSTQLSNEEVKPPTKISDLSKRIKHLERHCDTTKVAKKTVEEEKSESEDRRGTMSADEDKPSPEQEAVALRGLAIMKRNQILEQIVKPAEARILANFFEAENARPNETIVMLIDRAFGYGIEVLLMRPDLFEDVVDNELRLFLLDSSKAKRVLLDCILLHPEYVPIAWGGNILTKRQRERQLQRQGDTRKTVESKDRVENEKARDSAVTSTTKMLFDFLSNTFGEGAKDKSKDASPVKSASSSSEESPVKRTHNGKPKMDRSISEKRQEPFAKTPDKSSVEKSEAETEQSSRPAWADDRGERTKRKSYKSKVPQKRFYDRRRRK